MLGNLKRKYACEIFFAVEFMVLVTGIKCFHIKYILRAFSFLNLSCLFYKTQLLICQKATETLSRKCMSTYVEVLLCEYFCQFTLLRITECIVKEVKPLLRQFLEICLDKLKFKMFVM